MAGLISNASRTVRHDEVFYEKKWNFVGDGTSTTTFTLGPGNYEYPFRQALDGGAFSPPNQPAAAAAAARLAS